MNNLKQFVRSVANGMSDIDNTNQNDQKEKWYYDGFSADTYKALPDGKTGETTLDHFEEGCYGSQDGFGSAEDAIKDVCKTLSYDFNPSDWKYDPEIPGRLSARFLIDKEQYEASLDDIEDWKEGKLDLYYLFVNVILTLQIRREPTDQELAPFQKM